MRPHEGEDEPDLIDTGALQRRVLLTAVLTLALFFTTAYVIATIGASDAWLLLGIVLIWLLVVRPMMRPVREATALRRRLAYQAFLDSREAGDV